jgi:cytoskeletal protein RodZ
VSNDSARSLGKWLRERREELGISLQQAQADTRIRAQYIEALEADDYEALPDAVVGRGFVKNYAAYLGLDVQETTGIYAARVGSPQPATQASGEPNPFATDRFEPVPLHEMPGHSRRLIWLALALILLLAGLGALGWWGYPRIAPYFTWLLSRSATPTVRVESTAEGMATATETLAATAEPTSATPIPSTPVPTATMTPTSRPSATPTTTIYTGIFFELVFTDTSWLQITVDGVRQFQGELTAGTYRSWFGEQSIELRIGNAGAVSVTLNGQKLGTLGRAKEVVERVFEKVGDTVRSGTPTPTPTATRAPRASASPTPKPSGTPATPIASPIP